MENKKMTAGVNRDVLVVGFDVKEIIDLFGEENVISITRFDTPVFMKL